MTITDPEMYQKPFVAARHVLQRGTTPLDEQLCIPSEARQYLELVGRPAAQPK